MTTVGPLKCSGLMALNNPPRRGQTAWPRKRRKAAPVKHVIELRSLSEAAVEHTDSIQQIFRSLRHVSKRIKGLSEEVFKRDGADI